MLPKVSFLSAALTPIAFAVLFLIATPAIAQADLDMMPLPAHATRASSALSIDRGLEIVFEGHQESRLERAAKRFQGNLTRVTGISHFPPAAADRPRLVIRTAGPSAQVEQLNEDESYQLKISPNGILLTAPNPLGVLHGLQTCLQLVRSTPQGFVVDALTIDDKPRFPWRGLMLDTGRHFMPLEVVHQTLDSMEAVKMNVFHWHLSEDQGFRIESKTFPLLSSNGSNGLYYTQDEVREVIDYARDRGIRVVPEFDMPGHSTSWFVGYPDLASGNGPYMIETKWGVFDPAMDPTRESTYEFLDRFIGEMTALFPDSYFHIGGDECNGKEWDRNPRIQEYKRTHKLKDNAALQAYFTLRVQKLVTKRHKITVGWDEVLQPGTPKDVVIQSWRGPASLAEAAQHGYRGLLAAGYYIDLNQPASQHYAVDPLGGAAGKLTPQQQAHILGGEATMWSEFTTPEIVSSRIWPRTAAIAERLWSPQNTTDPASMYRRLAIVSNELTYLGEPYKSNSEQMLQRLAGDSDNTSLKVLANVVEPPKEYDREGLRSYDIYSPLNRLVDAVPPESNQARIFRALAAQIADGSASPAEHQQAREWLTLWRDNDAKLQPLLPRSALTLELVPVSHNLAQAAEIGLDALDSIEKGPQEKSLNQQDQLATLKNLEKPEAVLLNMIVPGVETLVIATKHN